MAIKKYSKNKDGHIYLSKNFKVNEFACNDGTDTIYIDESLVSFLQKIRTWAGAPVFLNSAYRTESYNKKIGGVTNSYHIKGQAADISVKNKTANEVAEYAESIGMKGIGSYDENNGYFTHIDTRQTKFFWRDKACIPENTFSKTMAFTYKVGVYEVIANVLNVREGAGTNYGKKNFKSLTDNAQKQIKNLAGKEVDGYVKKMICNVLKVDGNWGKTPSGWICLNYCKCVS